MYRRTTLICELARNSSRSIDRYELYECVGAVKGSRDCARRFGPISPGPEVLGSLSCARVSALKGEYHARNRFCTYAAKVWYRFGVMGQTVVDGTNSRIEKNRRVLVGRSFPADTMAVSAGAMLT